LDSLNHNDNSSSIVANGGRVELCFGDKIQGKVVCVESEWEYYPEAVSTDEDDSQRIDNLEWQVVRMSHLRQLLRDCRQAFWDYEMVADRSADRSAVREHRELMQRLDGELAAEPHSPGSTTSGVYDSIGSGVLSVTQCDAKSNCVCGSNPPSDPSPDCERCRLIVDNDRLGNELARAHNDACANREEIGRLRQELQAIKADIEYFKPITFQTTHAWYIADRALKGEQRLCDC